MIWERRIWRGSGEPGGWGTCFLGEKRMVARVKRIPPLGETWQTAAKFWPVSVTPSFAKFRHKRLFATTP